MARMMGLMAVAAVLALAGSSEGVRVATGEGEGTQQRLRAAAKTEVSVEDLGDYKLHFDLNLKPFIIKDAEGIPVGIGAMDMDRYGNHQGGDRNGGNGDDGDDGEPETGEPETGEPETGEPETGEPETGEPETGEPETGEPETGAPMTEAPGFSSYVEVRLDYLDVYPGSDVAPEDEIEVDGPLVVTFDHEAQSARIVGTLLNLEPSSTGGIHVHEGSSCETAGPHYWEGPGGDPWAATKWVSDENGIAQIDVVTSELYVALERDSTPGRTVVVHNSAGARVACGVLTVPDQMMATISPINDSGFSGFFYSVANASDYVFGVSWADNISGPFVRMAVLHGYDCPANGTQEYAYSSALHDADEIHSEILEVVTAPRGAAIANRTFTHFPVDTLENVEHLTGIYRSLSIAYFDEADELIGCGDVVMSDADGR